MRVPCADRSAAAIGDLSFNDLHGILARAETYRHVRSEGMPGYHWGYASDLDGFPLEQFRTVSDQPATSASSATWSITLTYNDTNGDEFDFEQLASVDRSTAYKHRSSEGKTMTRFKLVDAVFGPSWGASGLSASAHELIIANARALRNAFDDLDMKLATLEGWATSGIGMQVFCRGCYIKTFLPAERLRGLVDRGTTLGALPAKLVCKRCGVRNASFQPSSIGVAWH